MKKTLLFLLFSISIKLIAQSIYLDANFNNGTIIQNKANYDRTFSIATQTDGKFITLGQIRNGSYDGNLILYRYLNSGALDFNFGSNGVKIIDWGGDDESISILNLVDNSTIIAGNSTTIDNLDNSYTNIFISRITPLGEIDPTFSQNGLKKFDLGGNCYVNQIIKADNDCFYIVGSIGKWPSTNFLVIKIDSNGNLIESFGNKGVTEIDFGFDDRAQTIFFDSSDNSIIVGGVSIKSGNTFFASLIKLSANGEIISSFGENGKLILKYGWITSICKNSNSIYLFGQNGDKGNFDILKMDTNGQLDNTFGLAGKIEDLNINSTKAVINNEKIILFGYNGSYSSMQPVIGIYDLNGSIIKQAGSNGYININYGYTYYPNDIVSFTNNSFIFCGDIWKEQERVYDSYISKLKDNVFEIKNGFSHINSEYNLAFKIEQNETNKIKVTTTNSITDKLLLTIYNVSGYCVFKQTINSNSTSNLEITNYQRGLYIAKLSNDKQSTILKFEKK